MTTTLQVAPLGQDCATVAGVPAEVVAAVAWLRQEGRLAGAPSALVSLGDGRVATTVRVLGMPTSLQPPVVSRSRWSPRRPWLWLAVAAGAVGVAAVVWLALWVLAHLLVLVAGALLVGAAVAVLSGSGGCRTVVTVRHWH